MMVVNCQSTQQIADQLFVSAKTVNTYRYRFLINWALIAMSNSRTLPSGMGWYRLTEKLAIKSVT